MVRWPLFGIRIFETFLLPSFLVSALEFMRSHRARDDAADSTEIGAMARFMSEQPSSSGAGESGAPFRAPALGAAPVPTVATVAIVVTVEVVVSAVARMVARFVPVPVAAARAVWVQVVGIRGAVGGLRELHVGLGRVVIARGGSVAGC